MAFSGDCGFAFGLVGGGRWTGARHFVLGTLAAAALMLCAAPARAATSHTAYVTNSDTDSVTPIDTATNAAGPAITVGIGPRGVAITPDGKTAYVTNYDSDSVTPIDTATNTPGAAIPVGNRPFGVAITPDGKTAYVVNDSVPGSVTPIDTATNTPDAAIPVGNRPVGVAITPDGKTAYVTNMRSGSVTPIDTATNKPGRAILVREPLDVGDPGPVGVAITPNGKTAYVADSGVNSVTPIDTRTNTAGQRIGVGGVPFAVAITPDGKTVYVTNLSAPTLVAPIDTATSTPDTGDYIPVGAVPFGVAITPDGKTAYVTNSNSDSVTPIDTATNTPGPAITVGAGPYGVAVTPDQPSLTLHRLPTRVRIARLRPTPIGHGCAVESGRDQRELTAISADATCRRLRLSLSGTIQTAGRLASTATGTIHVTYKVTLPLGPAAGGARARVNHGRWRVSLSLPGVNLDPVSPLYLITVHYSGDHTHEQATARRRIRLESERAGL
jgi:YVTN family beta-propeller protein